MKKILLLFSILGLLSTCSINDDTVCSSEGELIGTWRLVETLIDPGDGSTDFKPVVSEKTVRFLADGTITSNGTLCDVSILSDTPTTGTYSIAESTISSSDCFDNGLRIRFELNNSELIISHRCFEPCLEKYVRING